MVMVFFHGNLGFSQFSTCHPVADLLRRTDAVGICRDLLAIDARMRLLSDFRAFRYAWTSHGDCGGWNRSGDEGKYVSGSGRCIGLEPGRLQRRPKVNRQGDNPALRDRRRLPEERMQLAGSKDGNSVYTESDREVQNGNSRFGG